MNNSTKTCYANNSDVHLHFAQTRFDALFRNTLAMSFVHERNKNNRHDTMRDELTWHNKMLNNRLRLISLFVDINEMAIA